MVERQPGRPTEDEFIGAALRFLGDNYATKVVHLMHGFFTNVHQMPVGKSFDMNIIRREQFAEGLPGERDSMRDFAIKQLSHYQKARKH
jgi:hypothetical protein